MGKSNIRSW